MYTAETSRELRSTHALFVAINLIQAKRIAAVEKNSIILFFWGCIIICGDSHDVLVHIDDICALKLPVAAATCV